MAGLPLLDTNPILRQVLDDHPDHSPRAHALFARIEDGAEQVQTTDTVIFEAAFTLEKFYKVPRAQISDTLLDLLQLPGTSPPLPGRAEEDATAGPSMLEPSAQTASSLTQRRRRRRPQRGRQRRTLGAGRPRLWRPRQPRRYARHAR